MQRPMKRIVTGHDAQGHAVVAMDGAPPNIVELNNLPGTVFYELWKTYTMPAVLDNGPDPTLGALRLAPTAGGTVVRIVDIPPDTAEFLAHGAAKMQGAFAQIGDVHASTVKKDSPHPLMHRTESVDYGIVIEGEITLVMDLGEAVLKQGDVVIQRGTNHAWANRSDKVCRIAFILIDGRYDPEIKVQIESQS